MMRNPKSRQFVIYQYLTFHDNQKFMKTLFRGTRQIDPHAYVREVNHATFLQELLLVLECGAAEQRTAQNGLVGFPLVREEKIAWVQKACTAA